jgi:hypothetical protein
MIGADKASIEDGVAIRVKVTNRRTDGRDPDAAWVPTVTD